MEWMKECFVCGARDVPLEIRRSIVELKVWPEHAEVDPGVTPTYTHEYPVCPRCIQEGLLL